MNVYVVSAEDSFPSEFDSHIIRVYDSSQKAKDHIRADFDEMCAECSNGTFMPKYFKEHTAELQDGYWEIRSKLDPDIYMSEYIEEFEVK